MVSLGQADQQEQLQAHPSHPKSLAELAPGVTQPGPRGRRAQRGAAGEALPH